MANGDIIDSGHVTQNVYHSSWKLQDGTGATDNGVWIDVRGYPRMTADIIISNTATVQIMGSNEVAKPAAATNGRNIGAAQTASAILAIDSPVRWIKAKVTAWTSGTVDVFLQTVAL